MKKDENNKNNENIVVNKLINNNKYFQSGIYWYYDKYLGFFWEKKLFTILSLPIIFLFFFAIYINYEKFTLKPLIFPISSYVDMNTETLSVKKLTDETITDPNILITKYLTQKYILARESLTKEEIEFNKKFILNNSSSLVYFNYKKKIEMLDEDNPLLNKKQNDNIKISIGKMNFSLNENNIPYKVIAELKKENNNLPKSHSAHIEMFNIEIDFLIDNIFFINKDFDKLNFIVLNYKKS